MNKRQDVWDCSEDIFIKHKDGMSNTKLADLYCCDPYVIRSILKNTYGINRKNTHTFFVPHDFFDKIDTEHKAYILGYFIGDGYVSEKTGKVSVNSKDLDIIEKIKASLGIPHKIRVWQNNGRTYYDLNFVSRKIVARLSEIGCPNNKSKGGTYISNEIPDHLMSHLLRGILESDGYLYIKKSKNRSDCVGSGFLGTIRLMRDISDYLNSLNINTYKIRHKPGCYEFQVSRTNISSFLNLIYKDASIYLNRKFKRYRVYKEKGLI